MSVERNYYTAYNNERVLLRFDFSDVVIPGYTSFVPSCFSKVLFPRVKPVGVLASTHGQLFDPIADETAPVASCYFTSGYEGRFEVTMRVNASYTRTDGTIIHGDYAATAYVSVVEAPLTQPR